MEINETNYRIVKAQIIAVRKQLLKEWKRNQDSIRALQKRQDEITKEISDLTVDMEKVGEFELESEYKFLQEIERKCKRCGKCYDKRESKSEELCPACFTSNA